MSRIWLGDVGDVADPNRPYGMERLAGPFGQVIDSGMHKRIVDVDMGKRHAGQAAMSDNASHVLGRHVCASIRALLTP